MNTKEKNMDIAADKGSSTTPDQVLAYELLEGNGPKGAPTGDPIMSVRDLRVSFNTEAGRVDAVRGVNFDLWRGRTLAIVGESGSGKSVTALSLIGLLDDNARVSGSVRFAGEELVGKTDEEMAAFRGKSISMIFQDPLSALTPMFTIGEQLAEALLVHDPKMDKQAVHDRCVELLETVGITRPEERLDSYPHEFSGGMRQRVVIAIAIANNPDVIIADEPTTALDVTIQAQILDVLAVAQRETGAAVVLITHDLGVVAGTADDVLVMYAGRAVERASIDTVFERPSQPYTMGLLGAVPKPHVAATSRLVPIKGNPPSLAAIPSGCPFSPRCPMATEECHRVEPELEAFEPSEGHLVSCLHQDKIRAEHLTFDKVYPALEPLPPKWAEVPRDQRPVVLEVTDLVKTFPVQGKGLIRRNKGTMTAVDHATFKIHEGETLALVGESGSGKSTTLTQIMELVKPESGTIKVLGKDIAEIKGSHERREMRRDLQVIFQDPFSSLSPRLPVGEIIGEAVREHNLVPKNEFDDYIDQVMDDCGLQPYHKTRYPHEFSGGQRQRICIARALALNPEFVVCDEPVSALDVSIQAQIINLLKSLQEKRNLTYLFISHDLSVVEHISDTVGVMYLGNLVEYGETDDIFAHPLHPYTKALFSAIPIPDPTVKRERVVLQGSIPSPANPPSGCKFHTRCPYATERCKTEAPKQREVEPGHYVVCHLYEK